MEGVMLVIRAHQKAAYAARTRYNAETADLMVAFGIDFTTSGEVFTQRVAGANFVRISLRLEWLPAARILWQALRKRDAHVLNIAGNSLSTLKLHGWSQGRIDVFVHQVLAKVAAHWTIAQIVSVLGHANINTTLGYVQLEEQFRYNVTKAVGL
jgi:hypothetical protein